MKKLTIFLIIIVILTLSSNIFAQCAGKALSLDGNGAYVSVPSSATGNLRTFTISFWINTRESGSNSAHWARPTIFGGYTSGFGTPDLGITTDKGRIGMFSGLKGCGDDKVTSGWKINDGKWHNIIIMNNGSNINLYIDGQYSNNSIRSGNKWIKRRNFIGAAHADNGKPKHFHSGLIDEFRIYNRVFSKQEIQSNMNRELTGDEDGLVLYYNFNELTPDGKVKDLSPYSNHGTLKNGAKLVPSDAPVKPPYPPELSIRASFSDNILKATEIGKIRITINNSGKGDAENVRISLNCNNPEIIINDSKTIGSIRANSSQTETLSITGKETLKSGKSLVEINITTEYGHYAKTSITIPTQALFVKPLYPPDLIVEDIQFIEPSGNKALDAYESGEIQFTLKNPGRGEAQNIHITLSPLGTSKGIEYTSSQIIEKLDSKTENKVSFNLKGEPLIKTVSRKFRVQITEEFGFDADPFNISFETKAYDPPDLQIEQIAINDKEEGDAYGNGNSIIEPGESIEVTAFIQNYGIGDAEDVTARVLLESSDRNITCLDTDKIFEIGTIPVGNYKQLKFYFYTSRRYNKENIPLTVQLNAKGLYGKTKDLGLKLGERTQNIVDVQVVRIEKPKPKIKEISEVAKSDVDDPIKKSKTKRPDGLAVIIGIEKYRYAPEVTFAERDAGAFYNTTTKLLGIPEYNIYCITNENATKGEFEKLFGQDGWLSQRVSSESEIFIYYSGHGSPDIKTKEAYLIPYDVDPNYANKGYSLKMLYENLHNLDAKSTTVILDACFVGQSREKETLLADARPVVPVIASPLAYGKITVFSATEENQISSGYTEQRHGLFTYFFLKGLQGNADKNKDDSISVNELDYYLKNNVPKIAGQMNREQTPQIIGNLEKVIVEY
ncbi:MAG: caspase family protein [Candidatus Cloacimonetes bacterium]|nr:caspase family protein [Candidatus Cloacimonadota bacterium]